MMVFAAVFILIHVVLVTYFCLRFSLRWKGRTATAVIFLVALLGPFAHRLFHLPIRGPTLTFFYFLSYGTMGFLATLAVFSLIYDLLSLPWLVTRKPDPGRRQFLLDTGRTTGVVAAAGLASGVGFIQAKSGPVLKEVTIPVKDLHASLHGLRIAQISDLHIGPTIGREYVEDVVARVNELKPDLIALTGDFVDGSVEDLSGDAGALRKLSAPLGIFYCTGNHEFFSGVGPWLDWFRAQGFQVLENEHRVVTVGQAKLLVAGIHDRSAGARSAKYVSDPGAAIRGAPAGIDLRLLLAHQPKSCYEAAPHGYDIQLSGHTHAGQFFPFSIFVYFAHPYLRGLHLHEQDGRKMWIYVNQGTGYWGPPLRTGIPSELTLLTLAKA